MALEFVDVDWSCEEAGKDGNCSFLSCFEARFPCGAAFSASHVKDLELPLCEKIDQLYNLFKPEVIISLY